MTKDKAYWKLVEQRAKELGSDGCTGVADIYVECCYEHDIAYKTGKDVYGNKKSREQADEDLKQCIIDKSFLKKRSLLARIRYIGVRLFGGSSWKGQ